MVLKPVVVFMLLMLSAVVWPLLLVSIPLTLAYVVSEWSARSSRKAAHQRHVAELNRQATVVYFGGSR